MSHRHPTMTFMQRRCRMLDMRPDYKAGMTSREVAAKWGMNDSYVRQIMRANGIARPYGRPRASANRALTASWRL